MDGVVLKENSRRTQQLNIVQHIAGYKEMMVITQASRLRRGTRGIVYSWVALGEQKLEAITFRWNPRCVQRPLDVFRSKVSGKVKKAPQGARA